MTGWMRRRIGFAGRLTIAAILLTPLGWAAWASLQPIDRIFAGPKWRSSDGGDDRVARPPSAGSDGAGWRWENYREAMTRLPLARFLLNSMMITTAATVGTIFSASMAGFAFARLRWRGRRTGFVLLLATMMVPMQVLLIPQFLIFEQLGWVNTYKPLIVPAWLGGGAFYVFLFRQFFRSVPRAYEDAARLDGASDWQVYWEVMLPMARPVVGAVVAISAVAHWQAFIMPLVYLSDFERYPVSVGLRMFHAMEGSWANLIMAASLIALAPPTVLLLVTQKYLMRNLGAARPG